MGISEIIFAFGFFKFGILEIIPLARDTIFENMNDGVLILDMEDRILDFNPALQNIFPDIHKNDVGSAVNKVFSEHPMLLNLVDNKQSERCEFQVGKNGDSAFYRVSQSYVLNKGKFNGKIVSFYEYTSEKRLLKELEKLATTDSLTGIYNRQHFYKLVRKEISRLNRYGGKLSLIMFDLDHFKAINDTYGHTAGDKALVSVVNTFRNILRETDILSRFGGEEFLILTPNTGVSEAKILAERLCKALNETTIQFDEQCLNVRASFGIAGITSGEEIMIEKLYKLADQATYQAKALGGNMVCVSTASGIEKDPAANNMN
jgi:diguanylate cyclase (GGDEF)-like protein